MEVTAFGKVFLSWIVVALLVLPIVALIAIARTRSSMAAALSAFGMLAAFVLAAIVLYKYRATATPSEIVERLPPNPTRQAMVQLIDLSQENGPVGDVAVDNNELSKPTEKKTAKPKPVANEAKPNDDKAAPVNVRARPAWVDQVKSDSEVYRAAIVVGPYTSIEECDEQLDAALTQGAAAYLRSTYHEDLGQVIALSPSYLRHNVKRDDWVEHVKTSVGDMVQVHVLLEFDDKVRHAIASMLQDAQLRQRLEYLGAGMAGMLATVGVAHIVLRRQPRAV